MDLHFHPFPYKSNPSEADIIALLGRREEDSDSLGIDNKEIEAIGSQMDSKRTVDLLLLQETGETPLRAAYAPALVSSARGDPDYLLSADDPSNPTIATVYNQQRGIQATMVSFERRRDGSYRLKTGDYKKLSRFASKPRICSMDKI